MIMIIRMMTVTVMMISDWQWLRPVPRSRFGSSKLCGTFAVSSSSRRHLIKSSWPELADVTPLALASEGRGGALRGAREWGGELEKWASGKDWTKARLTNGEGGRELARVRWDEREGEREIRQRYDTRAGRREAGGGDGGVAIRGVDRR